MDTMARALLRAKLVTEDQIRGVEVDGVRERESVVAHRRRSLDRALRRLAAKVRDEGWTRENAANSLAALAREFDDVFDQAAVEVAWALNLGRK